MADLYVAPIPECPVHGKMHHDFARNQWICHGFDGEGCDHVVRCEDLGWEHIGEAENVSFTGLRPAPVVGVQWSASLTAPISDPNARIALGGDP